MSLTLFYEENTETNSVEVLGQGHNVKDGQGWDRNSGVLSPQCLMTV